MFTWLVFLAHFGFVSSEDGNANLKPEDLEGVKLAILIKESNRNVKVSLPNNQKHHSNQPENVSVRLVLRFGTASAGW